MSICSPPTTSREKWTELDRHGRGVSRTENLFLLGVQIGRSQR